MSAVGIHALQGGEDVKLEEAANNVRRCINDEARRRELECIRITNGDQFAKLVEQLVDKRGGKK